MPTIPPVVPPLPRTSPYARDLPLGSAVDWLGAGWRDLCTSPASSLAYGLAVFAISLGIVLGLVRFGWDYALFPVTAGFLIFAPILAIGLYAKSQALDEGRRITLREMALPRTPSGGQPLFTGVLLCVLMLLWMRAAVIIYALFFGVRAFPGLDHIAPMLFATGHGLAMLAVGIVVGGLFAAFSFAISVFSIPMMLDRRADALTAMGTSWALVWNNLPALLVWGAVVLALFLLSLATGMLGLVIVFPWLGHASWHAWRAVR
ncbi:MAG: DUF2189 domain-containing protein [Sphingomonadales bacterium]|nr:DUF2189 domain-containing protein [Sphingomonadales bacterium]MDE2567718.1 DUF2189 domain-containing protein [Sphingomonadales bacterium]